MMPDPSLAQTPDLCTSIQKRSPGEHWRDTSVVPPTLIDSSLDGVRLDPLLGELDDELDDAVSGAVDASSSQDNDIVRMKRVEMTKGSLETNAENKLEHNTKTILYKAEHKE